MKEESRSYRARKYNKASVHARDTRQDSNSHPQTFGEQTAIKTNRNATKTALDSTL